MKKVLFVLMCVFMCGAMSQGVTILIDGSYLYADAGGVPVVDYFSNSFENTTVITGNYDNTADAGVQAAIAAADILVLNRRTSSGGYDLNDGAYYSTLDIPVVFLTSYVTRSSKLYYEGGLNAAAGVDGAETTVTAAGASVFGVAEGTYDFLTTGADTLGSGAVGTGDILATIAGYNLAVGWNAGDTDASGRTQAGNRLLWNISATNGGTLAVLPETAAGMNALTAAIEAYTGLVAVPEPATMVLLGLGGLLLRRKR